MTEGVTPPRSIRVPDGLWSAFKAATARKGETATGALVKFMESYVRRNK